jgi:hypothetical protein
MRERLRCSKSGMGMLLLSLSARPCDSVLEVPRCRPTTAVQLGHLPCALAARRDGGKSKPECFAAALLWRLDGVPSPATLPSSAGTCRHMEMECRSHPAVVGGPWSLVGGPSKWTKSALRWRSRQQRRLKDRARLTQRIGPLLSATRLEDRARFTCLVTAVVRDTMLADGAGEEAAMSRRALRTASRPCPAMEQTGRQEAVPEVTRRRRRGGTARHWRVLAPHEQAAMRRLAPCSLLGLLDGRPRLCSLDRVVAGLDTCPAYMAARSLDEPGASFRPVNGRCL